MAWSAAQRQARITKLKRRDGLHCWLCRERFRKGDTVTIDHAIPKSRGGSNELHNLRLAHEHCNHERGAIIETPPRMSRQRLRTLTMPLTILELTPDMIVCSREHRVAESQSP